ncbi:MAG: hypothetical protein HZB53_17350 [Chloroflexi bacterium]|nr:hypothetical protein [Chloroflexota bacterium]
MNSFNRLAMSLILLVSALLIAFFILVLLLSPEPLGSLVVKYGNALRAGPGNSTLNELKRDVTILGLITFVPLMVLLWLEVRRTSRDSIRITKIGSSEASLSMQAVAQSLVYYVDALPGIVRVRPRLTADAKSVSVRLDVETTPDIEVRTKTDEIAQTARMVVEERLGLTLKSLQIHLHHTSFPRLGAVTPLAAKPPAPVQTPTPAASDAAPAGENKTPLSS